MNKNEFANMALSDKRIRGIGGKFNSGHDPD